jgi:hypothetical protein
LKALLAGELKQRDSLHIISLRSVRRIKQQASQSVPAHGNTLGGAQAKVPTCPFGFPRYSVAFLISIAEIELCL